MNLDLGQKDQIKGYEIESVENEKQEHKLVGTFRRNRSLKLFSYNHLKGEINLVEETKGDEVNMVLKNGKLQAEYNVNTEASVNTNNTHFEALNFRTAEKRVEKFKKGLIKDLCNLKVYDPKPIYNF